jgi:hypothetical protein
MELTKVDPLRIAVTPDGLITLTSTSRGSDGRFPIEAETDTRRARAIADALYDAAEFIDEKNFTRFERIIR